VATIPKLLAAGSLLALALSGMSVANATSPRPDAGVAEMVRLVSSLPGIAADHAEQSVAASGPIGDFVNAHWLSTDVGSVWVTHEPRFEVHARVVSDRNEALVDRLEQDIGIGIKRHHGGASMGALNRFANVVRESASYRVAHDEGKIRLYDPSDWVLDELPIDADHLYLAPQPDPSDGELLVGHAGYATVAAGTVAFEKCTVGFTYQLENSSTEGFATAAHCADGARDLKRTTDVGAAVAATSIGSGLFYESCQDDVQLQHMSGGAGSLVFDKTTSSFGSIRLAGGYYIGQWGRMFGTVSGQLLGDLQAFEILVRPGGDDCPIGEALGGLRFDYTADFGDSGAPMYLWYGANLFLGATVSFRDNPTQDTFGGWWQWIDMPANVKICHEFFDCEFV
jgi:hypothetical protein